MEKEFEHWLRDNSLTPFHHPEFGYFACIEGFKGWLETRDEAMRGVYGFSAIYKRNTTPTIPYVPEDLEIVYYQGYFSKLVCYPDKINNVLITQNLDHPYWKAIQNILHQVQRGQYNFIPDLYYDPIIYDLCEGTVVSCLPTP